ncbi:TIGR02611 family protein [Agreia sp. VKM Ac-1783]|uniref:TIGR02611 family protein n=1 Tax=Agreia sp. VKM Ac-1783 TaxID=1938889 RepID=UPI000A2AAEF1|nr:TIGR02611 family protein [Agreia sp. VKM Ac-1783]SMQ71325.1 TIGR02611 family protein [Agreia sp. VKM Ac-1783]
MTDTLTREIEVGESPQHPMRRLLRRARAWVERHPRIRFAYRFAVGVLGATVAVVGLILVPLPGPGWLIVFLGIAILGTEFPAAHRLGQWLKRALAKAVSRWKSWRASRAARTSSTSRMDASRS